MHPGDGHVAEAEIAHQVEKIPREHAFIESMQVGLVRVQFGDNRLSRGDLGTILKAKTGTLVVLNDKFSDGRAGKHHAAVGLDITLQGYRQHPAAAFRNGLSVVMDAGDHDVEPGSRPQLVRQGLGRHGPTQDKRAHVVVLEVLQGKLARTQLVVA